MWSLYECSGRSIRTRAFMNQDLVHIRRYFFGASWTSARSRSLLQLQIKTINLADWKMVATTRQVSTHVGKPKPGHRNGTKSNASFCFPTSVQLNSKGDLVVCDQGNNVSGIPNLPPIDWIYYVAYSNSFAKRVCRDRCWQWRFRICWRTGAFVWVQHAYSHCHWRQRWHHRCWLWKPSNPYDCILI